VKIWAYHGAPQADVQPKSTLPLSTMIRVIFRSSQLSQEDCAFTTRMWYWRKLVNWASFYIRTCIWNISDRDYAAYASLIHRGVGKSSQCGDLAEFLGTFWNVSLAYKSVISYSLVCNRIHFIPSQTNLWLGFCDKRRIESLCYDLNCYNTQTWGQVRSYHKRSLTVTSSTAICCSANCSEHSHNLRPQ